ncbi:hypothetical protein BJ875DRAFT_377718 [Amylocarpus encephaloides]|uniref:Carbohydrate esterase family 16 protein n=1 Tax=Amylocarpus encephaloides TaxID=45428 RepID=A0A9P7YH79_9HELO|nr:hypothetical protein BJ875DRAFT_377718 [Amylocarpus encephaloides]
MRFSFLPSLALFSLSHASVVDIRSPRSTSSCSATSFYPGWSGIKNAFIFGDSYTSTSFDLRSTQPSPTNPLGNPSYPGWTSSNGPNWVGYLATRNNASTLLTYNLAYGGATMDSTLVAPYQPQVSSIKDQVEKEFLPTYSKSNKWKSNDTIFAVWDGINDVGNSWWKNTTTLYDDIFTVYSTLINELYDSGARNFVVLSVPPVERSPLALANGEAERKIEGEKIREWNERQEMLVRELKSGREGVNVFLVDAGALFTKVLDDVKSFPETAGYRNTTAYCRSYENGTPAPNTMTAGCGVPVNQYFWLNSLHPTYPMHEVIAKEVAMQLKAGPNVC